ncbi:MAG: hypothetical protein DRJ18_03440 [Candidatus Methanomethylicota archaeon]|mgnify:CR=1 FL=1|nr:MAG: hypothetical protein DRJ18_03440 [Candidatus Verstraetearchaeota archaeon]
MEKARITLPPFYIDVEGVRALVLEVGKTELSPEEILYTASIQLEYKGMRSRTFFLQARDERDLLDKLRLEVSKLKFIELAYGTEFLRRLIA